MTKKSLRLAIAVSAVFGGVHAHALSPMVTSWDLASEFTETTASPVWSYGYKIANSNTLITFPPGSNSAACLSGWTTSLPIVAHNPALVSCTTGGITLAPRAMLLHPGASGEAAVVRFKAPYSAQFRVSGQFYGMEANGNGGGTHTSVSITANLSAATSFSPYAGSIALTSPNTPSVASFTSFVVMLKAGQTLDFAVKAGSGNNYWFGSTGLNAVIERSGEWCGFVNPDVPSSSTC